MSASISRATFIIAKTWRAREHPGFAISDSHEAPNALAQDRSFAAARNDGFWHIATLRGSAALRSLSERSGHRLSRAIAGVLPREFFAGRVAPAGDLWPETPHRDRAKLYFRAMSKPKKSSAPALPPHFTSQQLCYLLNVTRGRLAQLAHDGGPIVKLGPDRYAIDSIPNFVRRMRERGDRSSDWNQARTELMRERAAVAHQTRLEREGRLVDIEIVELIVGNNNKVVRDNFLALGVRIAPQAHAARSVPAVQQVIDLRTREILEAVSETSEAEILAGIQREAARRGRRLVIKGTGDEAA